MQINIAYQKFVKTLSSIYDLSEAESISKIVFEDVFQIRQFQRQDQLTQNQVQQYISILNRLEQKEPVQYVLGEADFYGFKFLVNPNVLIPRQETEELVFWILEVIQKQHKSELSLLDIGTGSGCIPLTLKKKQPGINAFACDLSVEALHVAQENARRLDVAATFFKVDILDKIQWHHLPKVDIIVSNPPYIPYKEKYIMPEVVKRYEPELALFVSDDDSLVFYKTIIEFAKTHLFPGGHLFFELNEFNAQDVIDLMKAENFDQVTLNKDMMGKDRMAKGIKLFQ